MIEKKSEVMSEFISFSERNFDDQDFLNFLNNKKNDKKNGHGEDISIRALNVIPELYDIKNHSFYGRTSLSVIRNNQSAVHHFASDERRKSSKKHDVLVPVPPSNEKNACLRDGISLSNLRLAAAEVVAANRQEELTLESRDELKIFNTETTKINTPLAHLKPGPLELPKKDKQSHRLQSAAVDHMLKSYIDSTAKTAVIQNKSLNIDYPFLRWSGERSVKVSIPVDLNPSRHLTLLPSDSRAAEVLSRQAGLLSGFTTELLHPQRDDEENEKRRIRYNNEEEQE